MRKPLAARVLGVGLAAAVAAVTLTLALTGRLTLYINPQSAWFAVAMAILALIGTVVSFLLPLGAEADHGHDHGDTHAHHGDGHAHAHAHADHDGHAPDDRDDERADAGARRLARDGSRTRRAARPRVGGFGAVVVAAGGVAATAVVAAVLLIPPATLSARIAMERDTGTAPLFHGADTVALAATGDTASFGIGEWANVFETATNPEAFDGDQITLTGFATPGSAAFDLTRLVVTHCVIDAQPASIPIDAGDAPTTGTWVTVTGTIRDVDGRLHLEASAVERIDEPQDPYEY